MSATHSPPRAKASKWRLTRATGHCSRDALRVVRGDLARLTPWLTQVGHQPHGRCTASA
ncbi:hypothetical protein HMPREF9057_01069 [Actinomyces sp. oral taxon 171 str. F0337]|nr:hypothetical protein HMPREF9057_01069 [Actinomyces sp. oral taxon 171 str. F0337]